MPELYDNKYRFIKILGEGAFGKVFLANDELIDNLVAIKQFKKQSEEEQESIIREIQIVANFYHTNIVAFHHHFRQDGLLFLVMEYCQGGNLRTVAQNETIDTPMVLQWIKTLTEAFSFVHEKEIVHHDIKPDNILFTERGAIKISDFGIANTRGGTKPYMSPEVLSWNAGTAKDARVDIYALGVTLLELLTGKNPFFYKSAEEIRAIHDTKDFGISHLPNWLQEIILKAIAKIPEQRFQSMKDFNEAIQAKSVPIIFNKDIIKAGDAAERAQRFLRLKKWRKAIHWLDHAELNYLPSVNVLQTKGKYFLLLHQVKSAKEYFEKALKLNPRLDIQKDLGWINLEMKNYPTAISLLSDHLHRNPSDYEAYNLLLQCFYETNRYELAMDLARTLLDVEKGDNCFANNYYVSCVMQNIGQTIFPDTILKADKSENHFLDYNYSVILEQEPSHNFKKKPTLKSKLLFMDYRFNKFNPGKLYCTDSSLPDDNISETEKPIIKIGRATFPGNDMRVSGGTAISRRHCLIVNSKDDAWLYDLDSIGTYVDGERVVGKMSLEGKIIIRIVKTNYKISNDKNKLF